MQRFAFRNQAKFVCSRSIDTAGVWVWRRPNATGWLGQDSCRSLTDSEERQTDTWEFHRNDMSANALDGGKSKSVPCLAGLQLSCPSICPAEHEPIGRPIQSNHTRTTAPSAPAKLDQVETLLESVSIANTTYWSLALAASAAAVGRVTTMSWLRARRRTDSDQ